MQQIHSPITKNVNVDKLLEIPTSQIIQVYKYYKKPN